MPQLLESDLLTKDLFAEVARTYGESLDAKSGVPSPPVAYETGHVMIVDDEPINIKLVRKVLREVGFTDFSDATDPRTVLTLMREQQPDVVLLDIMMPHISGLEILEAIRATPQLAHIPVIVLTASAERATKLEALELGATDFLPKPVDRAELIPRVRNALAVKAHHDHLQNFNQRLQQEVHQRTQEVVLSRLEVVHCLARAAEFHDDVTGHHVVRVGRYAGIIGERLGLSEQQLHMLELAAQLHDVGKIGIPGEILRKQGKLTSDEYAIVKRHCKMGKQMFERMDERQSRFLREHPSFDSELLNSHSPLIQMASRIALTHHEHWDGHGYPLGLSGEQIPLEGRITAVADVFDALSTKRPYKAAFPLDECFAILQEHSGTQFDPTIVDVFLKARSAVTDVFIEYSDTET